MKESHSVVINVLLRGSILFGRFCFIFVAAKFLSLQELGTYSLIAVTIGYAMYFVGLDFYTYSTRLIISQPEAVQAELILNQFRVYVISYTLAIPLLLILFLMDFLPWQWAAYFFALLFTEHFSQEIVRLLVATGKPLKASGILFLRSAGWVYVATVFFINEPLSRTLETVLQLWLLSGLIALACGLYWLKHVPWEKLFKELPRRNWVIDGLKLAMPFLISTLAIRAIFTLDRYAIENLDGVAIVGVYTVYAGLAYAMFSFVDAAVIQFSYPKLVDSINSGKTHTFPSLMGAFAAKILLSIGLCLAGLLLTAKFFLRQLDKPEYLDYLPQFWWVVGAYSLWLLSYIPHYGLYAMNKDKWIFAGHIIPFFVFILSLIVLTIEPGISRVAISLFLAFSVSLVIKTVGFVNPFRTIVQTAQIQT